MLVWGGLKKTVSEAGTRVKSAVNDAASYASDAAGNAYASVTGWWRGGNKEEL